jgi:hypothetical protein
LTPHNLTLSAGIVTVRLGPDAPENIKEILWNSHRILVAYFIPKRTLRFSVAFFTTQAELNLAVEALKGAGI